MSMDAILAALLPDLAIKARLHLDACQSKGLTVAFTSGWRSPNEQLALYTKGRKADADGLWHIVDPARVVTNALPETAPHCRGAAYDLVPLVNEKPAWDRFDLFTAAGELGEALGLVWGGRWPRLKDFPHFELPGWRALPLKGAP